MTNAEGDRQEELRAIRRERDLTDAEVEEYEELLKKDDALHWAEMGGFY